MERDAERKGDFGETRMFLPVMTKCSDPPFATPNGSKAALIRSSSPASSLGEQKPDNEKAASMGGLDAVADGAFDQRE
ncbi:hypothetical protein [Mesorhizobium temperatum]|uniref:hypothetical protein n=1 Tax=Mesorhizobium temperatum TaxID=241416 RepID=UPI00197F3964|nr:hypothetical protein [Mesorhizobium temperatum]